MNFSKSLLIILSLLFLYCFSSEFLLASSENRTFIYRESTEDKIEIIKKEFKKENNGMTISTYTDNNIYKNHFDNSFKSIFYEIINEKNNIRIMRADLKNGKLAIRKGSLTASVPVGKTWRQSNLYLSDFINSSNEKIYFSILPDISEPDTDMNDIETMEFVFKDKEDEDVRVNGKSVKAVKMIMTFPGFKSLFWKAEFWYRKNDGLLVKYKMARGAPGTPYTIGELIEEK